MTLPATFIPSQSTTLATITSSSISGREKNALLSHGIVKKSTTKARFSDIINRQKKLASKKDLLPKRNDDKQDSSDTEEASLLKLVATLSNFLKDDTVKTDKGEGEKTEIKSALLNGSSDKKNSSSTGDSTSNTDKLSYNSKNDSVGSNNSSELLQTISNVFLSLKKNTTTSGGDSDFIETIKTALSKENISTPNNENFSSEGVKQKLYDLLKNMNQDDNSDSSSKIYSMIEDSFKSISVENNASSSDTARLSENKDIISPLTKQNSNDALFNLTMTTQIETGKTSDKEGNLKGDDFAKSSKDLTSQVNHEESEGTSSSMNFGAVLTSSGTETSQPNILSSSQSNLKSSDKELDQTSNMTSVHTPTNITTVTRNKNLTMTVMTSDKTPVRVQMTHSTEGVSSLLLQAADEHTTEALQKSQHNLTRQLDDAGIHTANMKIDILPTDAHNSTGDNHNQQMGGDHFSHHHSSHQENSGMGGSFYGQQQGQEGKQPQVAMSHHAGTAPKEEYTTQKEGLQTHNSRTTSLYDDKQRLNISV